MYSNLYNVTLCHVGLDGTDRCQPYIDTALLSNENVLVHCQQVRIVFSNGSIPANPILIHHWFPPGHFTERSHCDRLRQGQAGLHETKFAFRSMPSGVGG